MQPPAIRRSIGLSRRCHFRTPSVGAMPCSQNSSSPPGFSTRRISASAASGSGIEQSVKVMTIVSTSPSVERDPLGRQAEHA